MPYFPPSGGGGGSGTLTSLASGTGIALTPDPTTTTGTVAIDPAVVATLTGSQALTNKTIGAATLTGALTSATSPTLSSSAADGATAVGVILDHVNAFSTQAARDVSFRSAGVEYFNTWDDGTNVNLNVPVNKVLKLNQRVTMADGTVVGSSATFTTNQLDLNPGPSAVTAQYRFTQTAFWPQNATKSLGDSTHAWLEVWSRLYTAQVGTALVVSSNTIAPTRAIHHVGAGLIKTITVPTMLDGGAFTGSITLWPDAAFTYDATGNILVSAGGGTAIVDRPMIATYDGTKWAMGY